MYINTQFQNTHADFELFEIIFSVQRGKYLTIWDQELYSGWNAFTHLGPHSNRVMHISFIYTLFFVSLTEPIVFNWLKKANVSPIHLYASARSVWSEIREFRRNVFTLNLSLFFLLETSFHLIHHYRVTDTLFCFAPKL